MATFGTAELASIFGAWDDLGHLEGRLTTAINAFEAVQPKVRADVEFLQAWLDYLKGILGAAQEKEEAAAPAQRDQ
jgi:hypothetical protein